MGAGALLVLHGISGTLLADGAAMAESGKSEKATDEVARDTNEPAEEAVVESAPPPVVAYVPRSRGGAKITAGAGTRSRDSGVKVAVLAPQDHVALTTRAQPTLYWFVSDDTEMRVDLTIVDEEAIEPLLEITVPAPVASGIHALDLSEVAVALEPGKTYRWYVMLVPDAERRSNDSIAGGAIERISVSGDLERSLREARFDYAPYALSGIWYDAVDELLLALDRQPGNERLRLQRAALLEQAELAEVAVHAVLKEGAAGR
jgi:hypothetical protein